MVQKRNPDEIIQINLRVTERMRRQLDLEATRAGRSMNAEIVRRLEWSLALFQVPKMVALALLRGLDKEVLDELVTQYHVEDMLLKKQAEQIDRDKETKERHADLLKKILPPPPKLPAFSIGPEKTQQRREEDRKKRIAEAKGVTKPKDNDTDSD